MKNVPRPEELLEEILIERALRLDILRMPVMVPRHFKRRPRPKTAIIADRAREIRENLVWATEWDDEDLEP